MAPRVSGITDDLAVRLADVAAQAFYQVLSLQRPWGEFRELIPQSIETLASRGREAEQYRFGPKPKIFVSFDAIRTFRRVLEAIGTPAPHGLNTRFESAKTRLTEYVAKSILTGVEPPDGAKISECRWFPDYDFGDVNDHSGIHELNRVPDIRHTAEGVHFLLQYGGCDMDSFLLDKTAENPESRKEFASRHPEANSRTTIRQLIDSLLLVVDDKAADPKFKFDRLSLIVIAHLLNLLAYVASIATKDTWSTKVDQALEKLANRIANDEHYRRTHLWKTDSLGDVWGASFLMHLFDCSPVPLILRDCWTNAAVKISARLETDLVHPPNDDKLFETNIQALLALCKAGKRDGKLPPVFPRQIDRLSQLVIKDGILHIASLEIGEACQLVQLSLELAKPETVTAIKSSMKLLDESIRIHVGALAEQLNYGYRSHYRANRLTMAAAGDTKHAYSDIVKDVIYRCELIRTRIVSMAREWPIFPVLVTDGKAVPGIAQQALDFYRDILLNIAAFLGVGRVDAYIYPDLSGIQSVRDINIIPWDNHNAPPLPNHVYQCIKQLWTHALDSVRWRAIPGGLSGALVFDTSDLRCLPRIVKCASKAEILSEVNRYKTFVEGRLPGAPSLYGPVHWGHTYAIAYENAESRAVPSSTYMTGKEYSKGRTLEEILERVLAPSEQHWRRLLRLYTEALHRALQCLTSWKGQKRDKKDQLFSFGAKQDACFRFPFSEEELESMLSEAFGFARIEGTTKLQERIKELVMVQGEEEAKILSTDNTIHGDFHARNVYVVLTMLPGKYEEVTEAIKSEFHPEHAQSVANVALIDFANVTDGEVRCLDYGKYLRDLRARALSRAMNRLPASVTDKEKLEAMKSILTGKKDNLNGLAEGIFLLVLKKTMDIFDACVGEWNRKALLYQELIFLFRLMRQKDKRWGEDIKNYFGGWSSLDSALKANILGIQWALKAIEGRTRRVH